MANELLENIKRIGHTSAALCILKGLRAKIELNRKQPNRIWKHFPSLKGIILVGRAGSGKTHVMKNIFEGLNLHTRTKHNSYTSIWVDGSATVAGRREKLKENPHSVIFWNEISCGDIGDIRLLKQITEGKISYIKHGDIEETAFNGLLIGCANDFSAKGRVGRDLEALRDRMDIVEIGPPEGYDPLLAIETDRHYFAKNNAKIDWRLIADALVQKTDEVLTEEERDRLRPFWAYKVRECLDDRVLTRSGNDFISCFVFMKRFFGSLDDDDVYDAAIGLAYDSVSMNGMSIADLAIVQQDIVNSIQANPNRTLPASDIRKWLTDRGRFTGNTTMYRHLTKLVEKGFILKISHGEYSTMQRQNKSTDEKIREFDELLRLL